MLKMYEIIVLLFISCLLSVRSSLLRFHNFNVFSRKILALTDVNNLFIDFYNGFYSRLIFTKQ